MEQEAFCHQITTYMESSLAHPEQAASFICGLFLVARDVLFMDNRILEALDRVVMPTMRLSFRFFPTCVMLLPASFRWS